MFKQRLPGRLNIGGSASCASSSCTLRLEDRFWSPLPPITNSLRVSTANYAPDRLYWKQDLLLQGDVRLIIHGLTSTLLSGADGHDDNRTSLYLSPLQTVLDPLDDVVNLVLCHHPPDWFSDNDAVDEAFCARAAIQMLGHKHRQRIKRATTGTIPLQRWKRQTRTDMSKAGNRATTSSDLASSGKAKPVLWRLKRIFDNGNQILISSARC